MQDQVHIGRLPTKMRRPLRQEQDAHSIEIWHFKKARRSGKEKQQIARSAFAVQRQGREGNRTESLHEKA